MALVFETFSTAQEVIYYKSFTGYRVPPKMQSPIPFEGTKGLASFYIAHHGHDERLIWFVKILIEKQAVYPFWLEEPQPPRTLIFFEVAQHSRLEVAEIGRPIEYGATRHRGDYFEGKVGPSGRDGQAELLLRKVFTADFYAYWPSGRLKQRKLVRSDESATLWWYDECGKVIEQAERTSGGFSPADLGADNREGGQARAVAY